eukprot:CAMPEP_0172775596 /NCGR_PEP_ID=MMETSP1074-20121228/198266_1 /TAXON_ID=2916 /ORGANISM="Ceratium fusus, Strain PA161109" /LENGTH=59 /DNA_ID=CAMNT_0013612235 /DNA_START=32 /DNA_END=207 /DNA_ORIENTATION=+
MISSSDSALGFATGQRLASVQHLVLHVGPGRGKQPRPLETTACKQTELLCTWAAAATGA